MPVTTSDIDALWAPATPQFAYQIGVRIRDLIAGLETDDPVRLYGEEVIPRVRELLAGADS